MSKIVSLGRARKDRDRTAKKTQADANAAKHGRTKAERLAEAARDAAARRMLDGHEMESE